MTTGLTIDPFKEYSWTETWDRIDKDGNPLPREFGYENKIFVTPWRIL